MYVLHVENLAAGADPLLARDGGDSEVSHVK